MLLVIAAAGALWVLGIVFNVPRASRWAAIGVLLAAVLAVQLILPQGHPLREATGGSYRPWLVLGGLFVLVAGYRMLLARLHARAALIPGSEVPPDPGIEGNALDGPRANAQGGAGGDAVPAAQAPAAATGARAAAPLPSLPYPRPRRAPHPHRRGAASPRRNCAVMPATSCCARSAVRVRRRCATRVCW